MDAVPLPQHLLLRHPDGAHVPHVDVRCSHPRAALLRGRGREGGGGGGGLPGPAWLAEDMPCYSPPHSGSPLQIAPCRPQAGQLQAGRGARRDRSVRRSSCQSGPPERADYVSCVKEKCLNKVQKPQCASDSPVNGMVNASLPPSTNTSINVLSTKTRTSMDVSPGRRGRGTLGGPSGAFFAPEVHVGLGLGCRHSRWELESETQTSGCVIAPSSQAPT
jgi:hypothetical protein